MNLSTKKMGYIFIIAAMFIWGSVGVLARFIPHNSMVIVFYRVLFAFIALLIINLIKGDLSLKKINQSWPAALAVGTILALNWLFFFRAVKTTTVASATLSYYTSPLILTIFSLLFLGEKLNKKITIALGLGFLGVMVMMFSGLEIEGVRLLGISYGLLAALFYALFALSNKIFAAMSVQLATLLQTGAACLIFLPFILNSPGPGIKSLVLLLIMGIVHTALALILYIKGLRLIKAQEVGALSYLDPVGAIVFAFLFLGEIPGFLTILGGLLILSGSYLIVRQ